MPSRGADLGRGSAASAIGQAKQVLPEDSSSIQALGVGDFDHHEVKTRVLAEALDQEPTTTED